MTVMWISSEQVKKTERMKGKYNRNTNKWEKTELIDRLIERPKKTNNDQINEKYSLIPLGVKGPS